MPTQNPTPTPSYDGPAAGRRIARHLMHAAYIAAPVLAAIAALLVTANAGATIARLLARMLVLAGLKRHKGRRRIPTPPQETSHDAR